MKKAYLLIFAMALFAASCNKEQTMDAGGSYLYASTESTLTRTAFSGNDTDGYEVVWSEGDEITVGGYGGKVYGILEGVGKTSATFFLKDTYTLKDGQYDSFYRSYDTNLPEKQTYSPGEIKSSPMHAKVVVSSGKLEPVQFHNLCGLLRLRLKKPSTAVKNIVKITISSDQAMSGAFDIVNYAAVMKSEKVKNTTYLDCGEDGVALTKDGVDFFIAIPAGNYWSSTLCSDNEKCAYNVRITYPYSASQGYHDVHSISQNFRHYGKSVRAVCPQE